MSLEDDDHPMIAWWAIISRANNIGLFYLQTYKVGTKFRCLALLSSIVWEIKPNW